MTKKSVFIFLGITLWLQIGWAQPDTTVRSYFENMVSTFKSWIFGSPSEKKASENQGVSQNKPCAQYNLSKDDLVQCLKVDSSLNYSLKTDSFLKAQFVSDARNFYYDMTRSEFLQKNLSTDYLYQMETGTEFNLQTHTILALTVFESQKQFFLGDLNTPGYIRNPEKFFRFLIAYHDIGKGIAFEYRQDKSLEVEYSYPIAWRLFLHSGFNQSEARLGIALIHQHQVIGDFLRKKISADQAAKSISRISENLARTSVQHFFPSLEFLFVCDASSYPYLRNKLFTQNSEGKLELIDLDQYLVLKNTVLSLPTK